MGSRAAAARGRWRRSCAAALLGAAPAGAALAAELDTLAACKAIVEDAARLACYDRAAGRAPVTVPPAATPATESAGAQAKSETAPKPESSRLSQRWELYPADKQGLFSFRPYRPTYILPLHYTDSVNVRPSSPAPRHSVVLPRSYRNTEAKFQLSFKTKMLENLPWGTDVWFAYTQQSLWQLYNRQDSAPFRESDYEPELFAVLPTRYPVLGFTGRYLRAGMVHQSNGQSEPRSRSWNRVFAEAGFERGDFALIVKPWWRIAEDADTDDNPDIKDYVGRMELLALYRLGRSNFSLIVRNNLKREPNRGSLRLDWSFQWIGGLRGYVEAFTGYGESLIDYNHRQNTVGLGISLQDWW